MRMYIHIDGGTPDNQVTVNIATNFNWTHGPRYTAIQPKNVGLRTMWLDSIGPAARIAGNNTLLLVLEDDVCVAPAAYFRWLLAVLDRYARTRECRDSKLVGFSLSPILLQEMRKPFVKWDARDAVGPRYTNDHRHIAYLTVVPSSWGAAYWSDRWSEFDIFVRRRMQPPFYNLSAEKNIKPHTDYGQLKLTPAALHIPDARSNVWPKSW